MSDAAAKAGAGAGAAGAAGSSSTVAVWRVLVRSIATRSRVAGLGLFGVGGIVLGLAVHLAQPYNRSNAAWTLVDSYGLSVMVPIIALVFATAALGDLAEDGTLVYLWLRPLARWRLALAAFAASVSVVVPVAVVPLVIGAAVSGQGWRLVGAAAAGGLLATVAYSAVFCGLGLRVRRALVWGLAYLLIWEQAVARISHGAARVSLYVNTRSVAAHVAHRHPPHNAVALTTGLVFPLAVTVVALALTARSLDRGEVT